MNLNGRLSYEGNVSGSVGAELVADVEANPSGPATQTLVKIRVGDIIYSIPTGGGGGGTSDYNLLNNKPKINNHTIDGEMAAADLDLQDKIVFPEDGSKYLDGTGNFSEPPGYTPPNYSTDEVNTGIKWADGKDIYFISITDVNFNSSYIDINIPLNIEILKFEGGVNNASNTNFLPIGYGINELVGAYQTQNGTLRFENSYYASRPIGHITMYYTKY